MENWKTHLPVLNGDESCGQQKGIALVTWTVFSGWHRQKHLVATKFSCWRSKWTVRPDSTCHHLIKTSRPCCNGLANCKFQPLNPQCGTRLKSFWGAFLPKKIAWNPRNIFQRLSPKKCESNSHIIYASTDFHRWCARISWTNFRANCEPNHCLLVAGLSSWLNFLGYWRGLTPSIPMTRYARNRWVFHPGLAWSATWHQIVPGLVLKQTSNVYKRTFAYMTASYWCFSVASAPVEVVVFLMNCKVLDVPGHKIHRPTIQLVVLVTCKPLL